MSMHALAMECAGADGPASVLDAGTTSPVVSFLTDGNGLLGGDRSTTGAGTCCDRRRSVGQQCEQNRHVIAKPPA